MSQMWYKQGDALLQEIENTPHYPDGLSFWRIGQAGFVCKAAGTTLYIDPVLNDLTDREGNTRRLFAPPFEPPQVRADAVLVTHGHVDHMAMETLRGIAAGDPQIIFIFPGALTEQAAEEGLPAERIIPAEAGGQIDFQKIRILPVRAAHPVEETDEQGRDVALGYSIQFGNVNVLHPGDTYLTDSLLEALRSLPEPDVFFVPINGGDYFRDARNCIGNLNAVEAATLTQLLHADFTVPMHYDMIQGNTEDPFIFVKRMLSMNSSAKWHIPALGERFIYMKANFHFA